MSSKTYKLIKEIRSPVLSVAGKTTSINRILICSGGKRYIDDAVLLTGKIAHGLGATVTLLHVTSEPPGILARLPHMEDDATFLLRSKSELAQNLRREKETSNLSESVPKLISVTAAFSIKFSANCAKAIMISSLPALPSVAASAPTF